MAVNSVKLSAFALNVLTFMVPTLLMESVGVGNHTTKNQILEAFARTAICLDVGLVLMAKPEPATSVLTPLPSLLMEPVHAQITAFSTMKDNAINVK